MPQSYEDELSKLQKLFSDNSWSYTTEQLEALVDFIAQQKREAFIKGQIYETKDESRFQDLRKELKSIQSSSGEGE